MTDVERRDLLEVIDDRYGKCLTDRAVSPRCEAGPAP
jgi:hypothetical protein